MVPTSSSEPAKIKVKVRLDPHGILTIPSASMVEQVALPVMSDAENKPDNAEPMDTSADTTESQKENGTSGGTNKENADQQPQNVYLIFYFNTDMLRLPVSDFLIASLCYCKSLCIRNCKLPV